jgi:hypothetical protein
MYGIRRSGILLAHRSKKPVVGRAVRARHRIHRTDQRFYYRYNYCYNAAYGIALYQSMDTRCSSCEAQGADGVSIHDNLVGDDLNLGSLRSRSAGDAIELMAAPGSTGKGLNQLNNVEISHNMFVRAIRALAIFGAGSAGQMHNWTLQNNIWAFGNYGVSAIGGRGGWDSPSDNTNKVYDILQACITNWKADHNAVFNWKMGAFETNWPTNGSGRGNFFY